MGSFLTAAKAENLPVAGALALTAKIDESGYLVVPVDDAQRTPRRASGRLD
jgi:hypothetical protein